MAEKHLTFGILTLVGSLVMPKFSLLLTLMYFIAYQFYYFSVDSMKFGPIWKGFMGGVVGMYAYKVISELKWFKK